jgi:hypothetical protein
MEVASFQVRARQAFFEQFYGALLEIDDNSLSETCSTSAECSGGLVQQCCVQILMTSAETGESDRMNRCMDQGFVEATWDWTLTTGDYEDMFVTMKCLDSDAGKDGAKDSASFFKTMGIIASSMALLASLSI